MSCTTATSALNGLSAVQLQANLAEAQQALHALSIGRREVTVKFAMGDGAREVTYSAATMSGLRSYIAELQRALGIGGRRAIAVGFG